MTNQLIPVSSPPEITLQIFQSRHCLIFILSLPLWWAEKLATMRLWHSVCCKKDVFVLTHVKHLPKASFGKTVIYNRSSQMRLFCPPRGYLAMPGYFWLSQLRGGGCYCYPVGGGQECYWTFCKVWDSPHLQKTTWLPTSVMPRLGNLNSEECPEAYCALEWGLQKFLYLSSLFDSLSRGGGFISGSRILPLCYLTESVHETETI